MFEVDISAVNASYLGSRVVTITASLYIRTAAESRVTAFTVICMRDERT